MATLLTGASELNTLPKGKREFATSGYDIFHSLSLISVLECLIVIILFTIIILSLPFQQNITHPKNAQKWERGKSFDWHVENDLHAGSKVTLCIKPNGNHVHWHKNNSEVVPCHLDFSKATENEDYNIKPNEKLVYLDTKIPEVVVPNYLDFLNDLKSKVTEIENYKIKSNENHIHLHVEIPEVVIQSHLDFLNAKHDAGLDQSHLDFSNAKHDTGLEFVIAADQSNTHARETKEVHTNWFPEMLVKIHLNPSNAKQHDAGQELLIDADQPKTNAFEEHKKPKMKFLKKCSSYMSRQFPRYKKLIKKTILKAILSAFFGYIFKAAFTLIFY
ncbi:uncharacterized protein LOC119602884 [Lucilia sericata]|uniref:uncharacterized protein LOC119602884 n=1 Tax=Lucilia sericata TaxID=13632 RepID=UPI0018A82837|nr:uncharacterized protein LOC119602884 [Lucilia sericata]